MIRQLRMMAWGPQKLQNKIPQMDICLSQSNHQNVQILHQSNKHSVPIPHQINKLAFQHLKKRRVRGQFKAPFNFILVLVVLTTTCHFLCYLEQKCRVWLSSLALNSVQWVNEYEYFMIKPDIPPVFGVGETGIGIHNSTDLVFMYKHT